MKKRITAVLVAACMMVSMSTVAMAATNNYMSKDLAVKAEAELVGNNAPVLTIESSNNLAGNFSFALNLNNAEWLYEDAGTITEGINYSVISSTLMMVEVDSTIFDATSSDIQIPMLAKTISQGASTVTIDPKDSGVTGDTYTFAHVNFPGMTINVSDIDNIKGTFNINFKDDYPYQMPNARLFKVTITNGFVFKSYDSAVTEGKYKDIVEFKIDSKEKNVAYVETTNMSGMSAGTMTIKGVQVASTDKTTAATSAYLTIEPVYGDGGALKYELENFKSQEAEKNFKTVKFEIGGNYYVVNGKEMIAIDAAPFIDKNDRTMLPFRALANALDVADENITWNDAAKTVTLINKAGQKIVVAVGSNQIFVDGVSKTMDTMAVIKDGRTYLPVRAVLNAMGITDENIDWNVKEKSITVKM